MIPGYDYSDRRYLGWLFAVKKFGVSPFNVWSNETILDWKAWRVYYDEGLDAIEAIKEDFKHA